MDAEDIYRALFALTANLTCPAAARIAFSVQAGQNLRGSPAQPALCQAETDEMVTQVTSLQSITTLGASWLIYHQAGKDDDAIPRRPATPSWPR
ncbi:MAG: hypothetical protein WDM85_05915 [Caulobacteraceae bacterium]